MPDEFDLLAAKSLAGEASAAEEEELRNLLSRNAELADEFDRLRATWDTVRHLGPDAEAMEAVPIAIPPRRLQNLQQVVQKKFGGQARVRAELTSDEPRHLEPRTPNSDPDADNVGVRRRGTRLSPAFIPWRSLIRRLVFRRAAWAS